MELFGPYVIPAQSITLWERDVTADGCVVNFL